MGCSPGGCKHDMQDLKKRPEWTHLQNRLTDSENGSVVSSGVRVGGRDGQGVDMYRLLYLKWV